MSAPATLTSGEECFTVGDLYALTDLVAATWTSAAQLDWSAPAGTVEWSCTATADHAVDCVYAPAFFLASRNVDSYPEAGLDLTLGPAANPARLVESLQIATRMLAGVVNDAEPDVRAVIFRRPEPLTGAPPDFVPRAALELILHAHDVSDGLRVPFEPPADLCHRLREHTRPWPLWTTAWRGLGRGADPWSDLLAGSGRGPGNGAG
jgi:hypothetical protein